jgi:hypothetical protein
VNDHLQSSVALTPRKEPPYTLNRRLVGSKGRSVCFREGTNLLRLQKNDVGFFSFYPSLVTVSTELSLVFNKKVTKDGEKLPLEYNKGLYNRNAVKCVNCYVACSYDGFYLIFITT